MERSGWRHTLTAFALLAIGPLAGAIAGDIRLPGGGHGATALTSEQPILGAGMLLVSLAMVGATGTLGARLFGVRHGILCAGLVAVWVAWSQGSTEGVLMNARSGSPLVALMVEGILVASSMLMFVGLIQLAARSRRPETGDSHGAGSEISAEHGSSRLSFVGAVAVGAAAGLLGVHLFGVESLKGQTVFAVFVGAVLAGAASRLVISGGDEGSSRRALLGGFCAIGFLCVAGPIAAFLVHGQGAASAAFAGHLVRIANPASTDWLAGGLLGVPIGAWWASAMMPPGDHAPARA